MKQRIINYLLRSVARVIIPDDVLVVKNGIIYLGGKKITDQEKKVLQAEAKALKSMRLWSILGETIRQMSYDRGWKNSTSMEHLNTGKTIYHVIETQQLIVRNLENVI